MNRFTGPILLMLLLGGLLWGYTRHNQFPYYYHTDEPDKVAQVINGTRNYHHPLLLVDVTASAARMLKIDNTPQKLVVIGRWISTLAAIVAVAGLVLLTQRYTGWTMALIAGAIAGLHPFVFEATHYMKEDCILLAGLVWSWYALDRFCDSQSSRSLVFAGIASGIAVSGKYIGILTLTMGVTLVIYKVGFTDRRNLFLKLMLLCGVCALTFALINFRVVTHLLDAVNGVGNEFHQIRTDRESLVFASNAFFRLVTRAGPLLLVGAAVYVVALFSTPGRTQPMQWALLCFALAYLTLLCLTPLLRDRYLLPIILLLAVFSVSGVRMAARWLHGADGEFPTTVIAVAASVLILVSELPRVYAYERESARDVRKEMVHWIRDNLPANAVVAHEAHVWPAWDPGDESTKLPQTRISPDSFSLQLKNIENMTRLGITHAIVAGRTYRRTIGENNGWGAPQRALYSELEKRGMVLWQTPPGNVLYLSPGLTLCALPDTGANVMTNDHAR